MIRNKMQLSDLASKCHNMNRCDNLTRCEQYSQWKSNGDSYHIRLLKKSEEEKAVQMYNL